MCAGLSNALFWAVRVRISLSLFSFSLRLSSALVRAMSTLLYFFLHSLSVGLSDARFCTMSTQLCSRLDSVFFFFQMLSFGSYMHGQN